MDGIVRQGVEFGSCVYLSGRNPTADAHSADAVGLRPQVGNRSMGKKPGSHGKICGRLYFSYSEISSSVRYSSLMQCRSETPSLIRRYISER